MNHYIPGAYYPLGGTSEIAYQTVPIIERHGGKVLVDAPVTKILVNDDRRANGKDLLSIGNLALNPRYRHIRKSVCASTQSDQRLCFVHDANMSV